MLDVDPTTLPLIELFYRAVVEPDGWQTVLDSVVRLFDGDHAFLYTNKWSRAAVPFVATTGLDADEQARFFTPRATQQWELWQAAMPSGRVLSLTDCVNEATMESLDIYNEVIRPTNGFYSTFVQHNGPDLSFHFALCRPRRGGTYTAGETHRLQGVLPHLTTAFQLHQHLRKVENRAGGFGAVLDRLSEAVILTNELGHCVYRNARAARLLDEADGLATVGHALRGANVAITLRLHAIIASVGASAASEVRQLSLRRPSGRLPLLLNVAPIWRLGATGAGNNAPRAAIFIREPDAPLNIDKDALIDAFGFTPRESDVAKLLAQGLDLGGIAACLGLRISTVRSNLKHVYEKAGVNNQAGLVALVRCFGDGAG